MVHGHDARHVFLRLAGFVHLYEGIIADHMRVGKDPVAFYYTAGPGRASAARSSATAGNSRGCFPR